MLAAEGARAIGANTQLVRTGALYHDIGKLYNPLFFTENQHNVNPHDGLDPEVSAQKIISHVTKGLELAQKEKLPEMVRQFIPEHHGKSLTKYFYNTAVNNNPDPDHPIDRKPFMYPGPNPRSKETAILMMADSVEAASRSLTDYSTEAIDGLVDKIIDGQCATECSARRTSRPRSRSDCRPCTTAAWLTLKSSNRESRHKISRRELKTAETTL